MDPEDVVLVVIELTCLCAVSRAVVYNFLIYHSILLY